MKTLHSVPLSSGMNPRAENIDASGPPDSPALIYWNGLSIEEQNILIQRVTCFRELYARLRSGPQCITQSTAGLLYLLALAGRAHDTTDPKA